jgi:phosphatidylinositol alpha-1,6-mannosyltransferase
MSRGTILMLATEAFGGAGGIATATRQVATALAGLADVDDVHICVRFGRAAETLARVSQSRALKQPILYALNALTEAIRLRPGLIHCNHLHMAPLAWSLARLVGARLFLHVHGIEIWSRPKLLQRYAIEAATLVACGSRHTRECLLAHTRVQASKAVVLNYTYDERFCFAPRATRLPNAPFRMLTVSRLDHTDAYKGHDRVLPILARLTAKGLDLTYDIAGVGNDRPRLERLASELGIADRVNFLGAVSAERLTDIYRNADLFVMPSAGEGFGIAFVEAMACGTPALGLAIGGAADALGDGALGDCIALEDLESAIERATRTELRLGGELSSEIQRRFGQQAFVRRLEGALRS